MKIKIELKKSNPEYFEYILPIMSDELVSQINKKRRTFIIEQSEYNDILTELSAYMNHGEEYSKETLLDVENALDDFKYRWSYFFETSPGC
ncbi:MAG: hypothetical protein GY756_11165 [bacterium]|nr:hypothetical protein [bacterium]